MIANPEDLSWQQKVTEAVPIFLRLLYITYQPFQSAGPSCLALFTPKKI